MVPIRLVLEAPVRWRVERKLGVMITPAWSLFLWCRYWAFEWWKSGVLYRVSHPPVTTRKDAMMSSSAGSALMFLDSYEDSFPTGNSLVL